MAQALSIMEVSDHTTNSPAELIESAIPLTIIADASADNVLNTWPAVEGPYVPEASYMARVLEPVTILPSESKDTAMPSIVNAGA
ncbi:hypothetical protein ACLMJK_007260 [Lecanora helva]